jgi:hypothetical protein
MSFRIRAESPVRNLLFAGGCSMPAWDEFRLLGKIRPSIDFHGAPPFRMEPGKNAQDANLHRTGRHDLHAPQAGIIHRCHVSRPCNPAGGYKASEAFLRGNTQEITSAAGLRGRLRRGNVSRRRINVAVAPLVQIDVIALIWLRHCASKMPQKWLGARVTSVTLSAASLTSIKGCHSEPG